jgi:hypothetical protein
VIVIATLYNKANVAIGVANLYVAPADTPLVADTIDYGSPWGGLWVYQGGTVEGVKWSVEPDVKEHRIEESSTPALIVVDSTGVTVETELAEDVLENMKTAFGAGGTITVTPAASGVMGKKELKMADILGVVAVAFEAKTAAGFWRRVHIPRCNSVGKTETSYRRAENYRTLPVEFRAISDIPDITIREKTAEALP